MSCRVCVQLLIPVATTFAAYVVMQFMYGDELSGIVGPLVITAILAYFTANLFNEVTGGTHSLCGAAHPPSSLHHPPLGLGIPLRL